MLALQWAAFFTGALALWGILTLTGFALLLPLGLRRLESFFLAAPVSLALIGVSTYVSGLVGLAWGWWVPLGTFALVAGAVWLTRRRVAPPTGLPPERLRPTVLYALGGAAIFAMVQFGAIFISMNGPAATPVMGDAQFHLAGSELVALSGNVSPFTGLSALYEPLAPASIHFYPTFWHGLVALFYPVVGAGASYNLWLFVVGFMMWPINLGGLAATLLPRYPQVAAVPALLALPVMGYPGDVMIQANLGPYGLGIALLVPTLTALLLAWRQPAALALPIILLVVGAFAAHPSAGVLAALPVGMFTLIWVTRWALGLPKLWQRIAIIVFEISIVAAAIVIVVNTAYYQALSQYSRPTTGAIAGIWALFGGGVFYAPTLISSVMGSLFAVFAIWSTRKRAQTWLLLATGAPFLVLFVASTWTDGPFRGLTGVWWKDFTRLLIPPLAIVIVLSAVGLTLAVALAVEKLKGQGAKTLSAVLSVTLAGLLGATGLVEHGFSRPWILAVFGRSQYSLEPKVVTPLDENSVALFEQLDEEFTNGGVVIGPHASGVGFIPGYSDLTSFMPMPRPYTNAQVYLEQHFRDIMSDPEVCEILTDYGVVAFLEKPPPDEVTREAQPGLYDVDTSEGFELVASSGNVSLWRITGCD